MSAKPDQIVGAVERLTAHAEFISNPAGRWALVPTPRTGIAADLKVLLSALQEAREALTEAESTLALVEHVPLKDLHHGEEVEALGRRIGFGALMSSASASWRNSSIVAGGEFVAGPCRGTVLATLAKIRRALSPGGAYE